MTASDSESFETALLGATPDAVLVVGRDGTVTYQGPRVGELLDYVPDALVGTRGLDHVHPDDRELVEKAFGAVVDGAAGEHVECRVTDAGDSWQWVELAIAAPEADAEAVEGFVVSVRDVAERIDAQREREDVLDRMTDAFVAVDADWRFTYVNDHAEALLGIDETTATGTALWDLLPELAGTSFDDRFHEAMVEQEPVSFEAYYEPVDAWFAASAYPSDTGLSVFFQDVTERIRTEQALAKNEKALRELHDVAADKGLAFEEKLVRLLDLGRERLGLSLGFLTRIEDGVQTVVACQGDHELLVRGGTCPLSEAYCKRTIDAEGLLATRDPETEWVADVAYETFGLETYVGGKVVVEGELYGTLCFADTEPRQHPFRSDERAFVELLVEWMAYELERDRREERLEEQNERLEAFASMVSHDLRNPLTVAQGHLELAREALDAGRPVDAESLAAIAVSHDRMERMIEELLWLAREGQDVGETEPVDLGVVAREAWSYVETDAGSLTIDVGEAAGDGSTDGADGTATVEADRDRLLQLFENLFRNALEHGPAEGDGSADDAESADGDGPSDGDESRDVRITVGTLPDGFYVADDGVGLPGEDLALFESGVTTEADGTGYGLAIVERIAEAHGWTVTATDAASGGARFEFRTA